MTGPVASAAGPGPFPRPGRRARAGSLAAAAVLVLGMFGLVFGAVPEDGGAHPAPELADGVSVGELRISGVYVREPASSEVAAAYLTVANTGSAQDVLESVSTGAARTATLHDVPGSPGSSGSGTDGSGGSGGSSGANPAPGDIGGERDGTMDPTGPLPIPGGATVTLAPGRGHIMLDGLTGPLRPGDRVNLLLLFDRAGEVLVDAPVVAIGAPAPTGTGQGDSGGGGTR